jgi:hypothetical protein
MRHVSFHQMSCSERTAQAEFPGKNSSCNDFGELSRILAWLSRVRSLHPEKIKHRGLSLQDCTTTESSNLD